MQIPAKETPPALDGLMQHWWNYAGDAMFVSEIASGEIVEMNLVSEELTGHSRMELIGMPVVFLHPDPERISAANFREERLKAEQAQREQVQKELAAAVSGVVSAINKAMEMHDAYTAGHQNRVADLASAIAREWGWPDDRVQALRVAAQLHDIGKISVPVEILTQTAPLSPSDWVLVKQHVDMGYAILKDVPFRWPIAEEVRQHHERLDGSGYPRGLKEDQILIGARIIAVADVVDSMASDRPYRPACGLAAALQEIQKQAGTRLDAHVVRVCVSLFHDKSFTLAQAVQLAAD